MSVELDFLLEAVAELARVTGDAALRYYGSGLASEYKSDGSPVTVADREAEETARRWLRERFPGDAIMGEEFGEEGGGSGRRWLLDPIDGTKSFVRNVPLWGTLVAFERDGEVLAGAACYPAVDELLVAAKGKGCWHNGSRCHVSVVDKLEKATVVTTDDRFPDNPRRRSAWTALANRASVVRTWGDCYGYLLLATGRADVMVDNVVSNWDTAAVMPLVVEAGGVFTDFRGNTTPFGGEVIATNQALAAEVRAIIGEE